MATDPSPAAEATRLIEPDLTSPIANTPGIDDSNGKGGRSSFHSLVRESGDDEAVAVTRDVVREPVGVRSSADEHEHGIGGHGLGLTGR